MKQQRGKPFSKGQSGNPNGRPLGARNKRTLALETILDGEVEAITRKAVEAAKGGDTAAIKLILDRIYPASKSRPISLDLPPLTDILSVSEAQSKVIEAATCGELYIEEAQALNGLLEARRRTFEVTDLETRILQLEERLS
jgi:Family of unknown function (DUF5681)